METNAPPIRRILYCPHCCNKAPQRLVHTQKYLERSWRVSDGKEDENPWSMFIVVCETCGHVLLYENLGDNLPNEEFHHADLAYPEASRLHTSVPQSIRDAYLEANRIREIAPNAFAVQIRRALEALCEDRSAKGRSLAEKLKDLSTRNEIPPVLAEITDVLRIIGNIGAHGIGESVHPLQAYAINEFFMAVIEYVYVAPEKLWAFRERMEQSGKLKTRPRKKPKDK
jgi:hypothetical protein